MTLGGRPFDPASRNGSGTPTTVGSGGNLPAWADLTGASGTSTSEYYLWKSTDGGAMFDISSVGIGALTLTSVDVNPNDQDELAIAFEGLGRREDMIRHNLEVLALDRVADDRLTAEEAETEAELLREITGGELDLLTTPRMRDIAAYAPGMVLVAPNRFINFGDATETLSISAGVVNRLAERTGVEADGQCGRLEPQ